MPIIKRNKSRKTASPVRFKKKNRPTRAPRRKRPSLLKMGVKKKRVLQKTKNRRSNRVYKLITSRAAKIAVLMVIPLIIVGLIYAGSRVVIGIRQQGIQEVKGVSFVNGEVIGFKRIPAYPGSEFIFEDYLEDEEVKDFLTSGQSVYRLPPNVSETEIIKYYQEALTQLGWEHVLSVSRTDQEMKYGEYWVKDNEAIRVYSRINDIWYQKLTVKQAKSGLADEVKAETERELLLSASEGTELLPDYPWNLLVPKEYIVGYSATAHEDFRAVEFSKLGANKSVIISPIGVADGTAFDQYFADFINEFNHEQITEYNDLIKEDPDNSESKPLEWSIQSSAYQMLNDRSTLVSQISNGTQDSTAYTFVNNRNNYVYTFVTFNGDAEFLKFVIENITEKRTWYNENDFDFD